MKYQKYKVIETWIWEEINYVSHNPSQFNFLYLFSWCDSTFLLSSVQKILYIWTDRKLIGFYIHEITFRSIMTESISLIFGCITTKCYYELVLQIFVQANTFVLSWYSLHKAHFFSHSRLSLVYDDSILRQVPLIFDKFCNYPRELLSSWLHWVQI